MRNIQRRTFLCTLRSTAPGWATVEAQMAIQKGTPELSSAYYKGNGESTSIWSWILQKKTKQLTQVLSSLTVSYFKKLDNVVNCIVVTFPSLVTCKEILFQCFRKWKHFSMTLKSPKFPKWFFFLTQSKEEEMSKGIDLTSEILLLYCFLWVEKSVFLYFFQGKKRIVMGSLACHQSK